MQKHTTMGAEILKGQTIPGDAPGRSSRSCGKPPRAVGRDLGYPDRRPRRGHPVPPARIVAVADAFDAITNDRPYRPARSIDEAVEIMVSQRGGQFDPEIIDAFLSLDLTQIP